MIITRSPLRISLGGGFLMLYTEDKTRLRRVMAEAGVREMRVRFGFRGTVVVAQS